MQFLYFITKNDPCKPTMFWNNSKAIWVQDRTAEIGFATRVSAGHVLGGLCRGIGKAAKSNMMVDFMSFGD